MKFVSSESGNVRNVRNVVEHATWRTIARVVCLALPCLLAACGGKPETPAAATAGAEAGAVRPALTVTVTSPQQEDWPLTIAIDGNVTAWQEAVIGAELPHYRISEVLAQVGDRVRKGQVLARIDHDTVATEQAEAAAVVAELEAVAAEAQANAGRAQTLRTQGFYSPQMQTQYATAEQATEARLAAARARLRSADLRLAKANVTAPDDGVISMRSAVVGSLTQPGQELFRLIRGGRLEWQAEIPASQLAHVKPGVTAQLVGPAGEAVRGRVRNVAPSVDPRTRNGIVYVDLAGNTPLRAGMFARGDIETGRATAMTLPQAALVLREGFSYVFAIATAQPQAQSGNGENLERVERVEQIRVKAGRRNGDRIEILEGLKPGTRVVASGAGFLADGDIVKIVAAQPKAASTEPAGKARPAESAAP